MPDIPKSVTTLCVFGPGHLFSSQSLGSEIRSPSSFVSTQMKISCVVLVLPLLTACVSIDLPGVVSDTARVAKDTYRSVAGKDEREVAKMGAEAVNSVSNTYIGQDSQTAAELKQLCVSEAATKLFKASGKEVPYTITESTISTVNNAIAANCKVTANKITQTPSTEKK